MGRDARQPNRVLLGSSFLAPNGCAVSVVVGAHGVSVLPHIRAQQLAEGALSGSAFLTINPTVAILGAKPEVGLFSLIWVRYRARQKR